MFRLRFDKILASMASRKRVPRTQEPQYDVTLTDLETKGPFPLGPVASYVYRGDPRRLGIVLARYKFCSKMLAGKASALEIGCGDGFGMRVVLQTVKRVDGADFDPVFTDWCGDQARREGLNSRFQTVDLTKKAPAGVYEAAYCLDVLEHIPRRLEGRFVRNICKALTKDGVCIIGTPNIAARAHASPPSRAGHVNLKSADTLRDLLSRHFRNVFIFSMNDEVVHTGFHPMAHYLFGVCAGLR
jgi:2-polyprenyl-3-methyl-5-hydroxy-6-metoxy-1,4-benzoquinol methylase